MKVSGQSMPLPGKQTMKYRKFDYDPARHDKQVYGCRLIGYTDTEISEIIGINFDKFKRWLKDYPSFREAHEAGGIPADERVVRSLYERAVGYSHKAVKIMSVPLGNNQGSQIVREEYIQHYPPEVMAISMWLNARQRKRWCKPRDDEGDENRIVVVNSPDVPDEVEKDS